MILGIGTDIVDSRRVARLLERFGPRFLERCFSEEEQERAARFKDPGSRAASLARRFAAKEACAKALGTGFGQTLSIRDIAVANAVNGAPFVKLNKRAQAAVQALYPSSAPVFHLSLSDEPPYALAYVIVEARGK